MTQGNQDQIAEWNGVLGERWAMLKDELDLMLAPFGAAALEAADPRPGEHAIDIGCGSGAATLALARAVGASGRVLGVDVAAPLLAVARREAAAAGFSQATFLEADASSADLPASDLLFSRFGVMFFADPGAAFRHLASALRSGGRLAFACWRAPRENSWAMTPVAAARTLTPAAAPSDPHAPGPFAFADPDRVKGFLEAAGLADVAFDPFDAPVRLGESPRDAAERAARAGPLGRIMRETAEARWPELLAAVEAELARHAAPDGSVTLTGAIWVFRARKP